MGPFAYIPYDYLGIPDHRKGMYVPTFGEKKTLVHCICFNLIIGGYAQIPMERENLVSSWEKP